jgi:hypothetical protein
MDRLPTIGSVPALVHALAETCVFVISLPAYCLVQHCYDAYIFFLISHPFLDIYDS